MSAAHSPSRGQTSLEYLLLLAVVAVIVIASFGPGSLVSQVHDASEGYYNTVTSVIMGKNPQPINGGWCPVTCPPAGTLGPTVMYASCECPAPAFGGKYCTGTGSTSCAGVTACGSCPTGQACGAVTPTADNPSGCGCSNGLICGQGNGPLGSIPSPDCSGCICILGTTFDQNNNSCDNNCPNPCTTWNGTECIPVTATACGANRFCDPNRPSSCECACDQYSYWNGSSCVYCTATSSGQCTALPNVTVPPGQCPPSSAASCQPLPGPGGGGCPNNMYCDTKLNACQCDCDANFCTVWQGNACVPCGGSGQPACNKPKNPCPTLPNGDPLHPLPDPNGCGTDSNKGNCGSNGGGCCPPGKPCGQKCSSDTPGTPGTCISACSDCQIWNSLANGGQGACVSTTPCGSNNCGFDSCGNPCGTCPDGQPCSSSSSTSPGLCCLPCQTLKNGACVNNTLCGGNNNCETDSCGNPCGSCTGTQKCSSTTPGTPGTCEKIS